MAKNNEKEIKEKKQNSNYFKGMKAELKKVVWPTPKELFNNTVAVITFVLVIAIIVFVLDFCFDNLNKYGITKFQQKIQSSFSVNEDQENQNVEDNTTEGEEENTENAENMVKIEQDTNNQEETETTSEENQ